MSLVWSLSLAQKLFSVTEDSTYDISQTRALPRPPLGQAGLQPVNTSQPAWPGLPWPSVKQVAVWPQTLDRSGWLG